MRVLLVDHDSEGLEAVARAIRGVLELDCVTSKGDALLLLRQNTYDVLIACERCVDGSGLDLLARTTRTTTPLKRIFSAPKDRVGLLGPRLAPFKVQRTINYPIDLEELWLAIAQVTGSNDDTDGTIERVVLDERGYPSAGTTPRGPIPPRPPAPLREVRSTPTQNAMPSPAISASSGGRTAAARFVQPAPEPPLQPPPRTPPPPRTTSDTGRMRTLAPPATTSDTGRMRAPAPPRTTSDTGRMRVPAPPTTTADTGRMRAPLSPRTTSDTGRMRTLPPPMQPIPPMPLVQTTPPLRDLGWTAEKPPTADDFAAIAAQARLGVQEKAIDEAARRKRKRLLTAGGIAVVVAAAVVFLIETFYDPEAWARERAIAAEVERMAEQQKVTDNLALIEIDIENSIMKNDFDAARVSLAQLIEKSPEHPRRAFLQASIDRAAELANLELQKSSAPVVAQPERAAKKREERAPGRANPRARDNERAAPRERTASTPPASRTYGSPIGQEVPRATLPLDAPINSAPTTVMQRTDNSFPGRTVETSESPVVRPAAYAPSNSNAPAASGPADGSAVIAPLPAAPAAAPAVPSAIDVVPAKLVKRVTPVAPASIATKTRGEVVLRFEIGENGKVSQIEVVESTPQGVFDEAARDAVRKWVYEPRKENGVAVSSMAQARLVFDIGK
jgi:protein TonB